MSELIIKPDLSGDGYFLITRGTTQKLATESSVADYLTPDALGAVGGSPTGGGGGSESNPVSPSGGVYKAVLCGGVDTLYLPTNPTVGDKIIAINVCEPPCDVNPGGNTIANSDNTIDGFTFASSPVATSELVYVGSNTWHLTKL